MIVDELGDRMKLYEGAEAGRKFMPLLPIVARMDGRGFSRFTKGMERPFDPRMSQCMINTTEHLVRETNALMGYTQSDEITLVWFADNLKSQTWFNGRITKMIASLAAETTLAFYEQIMQHMPEYAKRRPRFDSRVWQVPNHVEAANTFLWREWDATKNSIQMAGHHYFSHKQLHKKHGGAIKDMLMDMGVNWNRYPAFFKRGTFIQRAVVNTPFTVDELSTLPPKHKAHTDPNLVMERSIIRHLDMPPFNKVINRPEVIFNGELPRVMQAIEEPA
jgi:tRNA(His) guanylyltransferase